MNTNIEILIKGARADWPRPYHESSVVHPAKSPGPIIQFVNRNTSECLGGLDLLLLSLSSTPSARSPFLICHCPAARWPRKDKSQQGRLEIDLSAAIAAASKSISILNFKHALQSPICNSILRHLPIPTHVR
ncbi:uncharacterized protein VTP21DRAFT_10856 [Calcarisporiella thermophila]|uniref:uncharacterized protein n=1 Tax=Calcarisporiella thermophila TaxID=911321 RepID=UPI0037427CCD